MIEHLACVMDGNRRWAKKNGVSLTEGVLEGLARAQTAIDVCIDYKIANLSLFAFSIENFQRSALERACIFGLLLDRGLEFAEKLVPQGIKVKFVGDKKLFPESVNALCESIEDLTQGGSCLTVRVLFGYGSRQEIIAATIAAAQDLKRGKISEKDLTPDTFKHYFWMGAVPDPDLIIRTGYAHRLSNFLLFQAAYSELYFPDCLWPDMNENEFEKAFEYFDNCKRNFGK